MHYKICNPDSNIKIKDIDLRTQIYLDESQRFEYYFRVKFTIEWVVLYVE